MTKSRIIIVLILIALVFVGVLVFRPAVRVEVRTEPDPVFLQAIGTEALPELERKLQEQPRLLQQRDAMGGTVLHRAVMERRHDVLLMLVLRGADPNLLAAQGAGGTPLHYAAALGDTESVGLLLKHGSDPRIKNNFGQTPLEVATEAEQTAVVKRLKESESQRQ